MKSNKLWIITVCLLFMLGLDTYAQKAKREPLKHEKEVRDMVAFLQFMLNTLGDESTSSRDKDVLITQSFTKIFRDGKVQVEDDLAESRNVITNKDVQAYLKDVDFFYKTVKFEFNIDNIQSMGNEDDKLIYKVSTKRNITGTTIDGTTINKTIPRFIEINYNTKDQDLKIVSIYTNEFDEKEALMHWWNGLSYEWQEIFRRKLNLVDSIRLDDIKAITSIETLDLSNNRYIQNIEPLAQVLDLKVLNLSKTNLTDLTPIRNLTELVDLDLSHTQVDDLSPLKYSINLRKLNLNNTLVSDISIIEKLSKLEGLQLQETFVEDFSPLQYLLELKKLNIEATKILDLAPIDSLAALQDLNVSRTMVEELSPIGRFAKLKVINIDSTQVNDINTLSNLKNLSVVYMNYTSVAELDALKNLPNLEKVYCDHTAIDQASANAFRVANPDVLVIFGSEDLKGWWDNLTPTWRDVLRNAASISITPSKEELAKVTNLDSINFSGRSSIRSVEALEQLQKLKVIIASASQINDLSPLSSHEFISTLDISNTAVTDLSPLTNLTNLRVLKAENTLIQNIDTLRALQNLQKVYLDGTGINDDKVRTFLKTHPQCLVLYKTPALETWWNGLSESWKQVFQKQIAMNSKSIAEHLHKLVELENVTFDGVDNSDLSPLTEFVRLKKLQFTSTSINDLSPLSSLKTLTTLRVNDNPIRAIAPLSQLENLEELDISNTPINELEPLSPLKNLKSLNCSGTPVSKLNTLKELPVLEYLDCSNTGVKKIDPITRLPLKTLKCYNTKVSKKQIEGFKKRNPDCNVIYYR